MNQNNIELRLLIKGKPITEYYHNGSIFVEGRDGSPYEVEITNRNQFRVEAIISVDGLSVIDGKEASDQSSGYLLNANETIRVPGWKLDNQSVAAFLFGDQDRSYAAQSTGSARNTGVIGVMVFRELHQNTYYGGGFKLAKSMAPAGGGLMRGMRGTHTFGTPTSGDWGGGMTVGATLSVSDAVLYNAAPDSHNAIAQTASLASVNNLGTGFGKQTEFATTEVSFNRGDLHCMSVLYYDNARGLKARGIQVGRPSRTRYNQQPQAFPGMNKGCVPPPGWNG